MKKAVGLKRWDFIEVMWEDSVRGCLDWVEIDEVVNEDVTMCRSVGMFLGKRKKQVVLALTFDTCNEHVNGTITIPCSAIRNITRLKGAK